MGSSDFWVRVSQIREMKMTVFYLCKGFYLYNDEDPMVGGAVGVSN